MTVPEGVLARITGVLDRLRIPYMACGSLSCTAYGEPRMSNDVDIVINPSRSQLEELAVSLEPDYYVSKSAAIEAFEQKGMFNVIDRNESFKVDLIILKNGAYDTEGFSRKRKRKVAEVDIWLLSPEDSILSKLEWCKGRGNDNRQVRDAAGIVAVQKDRLDLAYLRKWAKELGVEESLEAVLKAGGM